MATDIVREPEGQTESAPVEGLSAREQALTSWVMKTIQPWREWRDRNYLKKWDEYYRLWRGIWLQEDKNRTKERSRIISPALQQSIEATVAELEAAIFNKVVWFDFEDDLFDKQQDDVSVLRDIFQEKLDEQGAPDRIMETFLNGALYGNGITKLLVDEIEVPVLVPGVAGPDVQMQPEVVVKYEAIDPREFVIDPGARSIDEALGVAHEPIRPSHTIHKKQADGIYKDIPIGNLEMEPNTGGRGEQSNPDMTNRTKITEYHGLVPREFLPEEGETPEQEAIANDLVREDRRPAAEHDMVEAIVTIANERVLLRAVRNPILTGDRAFVSYQHDTVPNRFWGRGVAEKGYNSQKALDAETRTRIDAMAFSAHPMVAVDVLKMPRGASNFEVYAGRVIGTNGPPGDTIAPVNFGAGPNAATFHQTGELERWVQMSTGAFDSATPTSVNARNQTASGMSMIQAGSIKRTKRTLQNIERQYMKKLLYKTALRFMQFDTTLPVADYRFKVVSTMGMIARELEQGQMLQLMSVLPPESPVFPVLVKGVFDNLSLSNSAQLDQAVQAWLQQVTAGPSEEQQILQMLEMEAKRLENEEVKATIQKLLAEAQSKLDAADSNKLNAISNAVKTGRGD